MTVEQKSQHKVDSFNRHAKPGRIGGAYMRSKLQHERLVWVTVVRGMQKLSNRFRRGQGTGEKAYRRKPRNRLYYRRPATPEGFKDSKRCRELYAEIHVPDQRSRRAPGRGSPSSKARESPSVSSSITESPSINSRLNLSSTCTEDCAIAMQCTYPAREVDILGSRYPRAGVSACRTFNRVLYTCLLGLVDQ